MPSDDLPSELSQVPVPPDELRGRQIWTLDALVPLIRSVWAARLDDRQRRYAELADMAAIYVQLDWDVQFPPYAQLIGRPHLLNAVVDGGRRVDEHGRL